MELKQELTKLELTREELSTVQRGHRSVVKSEPEVSCVYANISTTSVIRAHTRVTTPHHCNALCSLHTWSG